MSERHGFLEELKRRHVWRVTIAYVVVGWLVIQAGSVIIPAVHLPASLMTAIIVIGVLGFPVVVVLAWAFEITPAGIRRTEPAGSPQAREAPATRAMGRKLNAIIIAVLVLAVALLGWRVLALQRGPARAATAVGKVTSAPLASGSAAAQASLAHTLSANRAATSAVANVPAPPATTAAIPQKSVAVLPFANEGAKSEQFFSDGLSEDLITALSQFAGLKVISRNSAFQFRDSKDSSAKIGTLLGVAHLLEGSVQRAGDEVRITATLVNASDGTVVWTQRYDKPYKDLFALQDAITHAVADALKAQLLTAPGAVVQSDRPPSGNLAAYTAYQHGIAYDELGTEASMHQAIAAFTDAIRLDPKYAAAYAHLSGDWGGLIQLSFLTDPAQIRQAWANARKASATALALDPDSSLAHQIRGDLLLEDFDWTGAEAEFRHALQLAPQDAWAPYALGLALATLGQNQRAVDLTRKSLAADPRSSQLYAWLSAYLAALGQLGAAEQAITTAIALQPGAAISHEQLAIVEILRGDAKAALAAAQQEPPGLWHNVALALALQIGPDRAAADAALQKLIAKHAGASAYEIAEVFALRRDPDAMFQWLDRAWANREPNVSLLLQDPLILRYRDDPRFAAFCTKVGLPTTTDAIAMK